VDTETVGDSAFPQLAQENHFPALFLDGDVGAGQPFVKIVNVTSKSFGIHYYESSSDKIGFIVNVVAKNTAIPFQPHDGEGESHSSTLFPNQTSCKFEVWENEETIVGDQIDIDICTKIGEMTLTGLPPGRPPGQACTVFMEIDREGLLHAWGLHDETHRRCDVTIKTERVLSREEVHDAKSTVDWFEVE